MSLLDGVSRETRAKLDLYSEELRRWQTVTNLIARSTIEDLWTRHFADSLQLGELAPGRVWADLGTGAGFPGLVLALARPDTFVHLVESDSRRCAFLRHVARRTGAPVRVWESRIEVAATRLAPQPDVVTARALASLPRLLQLSESLLTGGAVGLFPKGRSYSAELTAACGSWTFAHDIIPSRTEPDGRIIRIRDFAGPRISRSVAHAGDPNP